MKPDWKAIKLQYLQTGVGLRELARESSVSFHTLAKRSKREDWPLARRVAVRAATGTATTGLQVATVASEAKPLMERSQALREQIVAELERDLEIVRATPPEKLADAVRRQGVLASVTNTAKVCLNWGESNPAPLVRIHVLAQASVVSVSPAPTAKEAASLELPERGGE